MKNQFIANKTKIEFANTLNKKDLEKIIKER